MHHISSELGKQCISNDGHKLEMPSRFFVLLPKSVKASEN